MAKSGKSYTGSIPQRIDRIKKEITEIEKELKAAEVDNKNKEKMKEIDYPASVFDEVASVKGKLAELIKTKGYEEIIQWETPSDAGSLHAADFNKKLTDTLIHTLKSVFFFF